MISLDAMYRKRNLTDLDEFVESRYAKNLSPSAMHMPVDPASVDPHGPNFRRIGASTWMCAKAALTLLQGQDAMILGRDNTDAKRLAQLVCEFLTLYRPFDLNEESASTRRSHTVGAATLRWANVHESLKGKIVGQVFNDRLWKERTARRALGPFAMIREVRYEGTYNAYAEDNEFILELVPEGVQEFLWKHPDIATVGFFRSQTQPVQLPSLRGALSLGSPVTRTMSYNTRRGTGPSRKAVRR